MDELPEMETIAGRIIVLRGQRVMLDADLAALYGVKTERLNEQVRRNVARFPADFVFRLDLEEWKRSRSQNATTLQRTTARSPNLPQIAGGSQKHRDPSRLPLAFVRMRSALAASAELGARMEELAREVERQGGKLATHDAAILRILDEIRRLTQFPEAPRRGIGFTAEWPEEK